MIETLLKPLEGEDADKATDFYNRGNSKTQSDQHLEAITDYDEAIRLNPDFTNAFYNRGICKSILGQTQEAIADLDEAIRLNREEAIRLTCEATPHEDFNLRAMNVNASYWKILCKAVLDNNTTLKKITREAPLPIGISPVQGGFFAVPTPAVHSDAEARLASIERAPA